MSDEIKHECGLAFIRLRKNFSYYQQKFGTALYGLNKLYLLMEKQHNRGQDGAGIAAVKLNTEPGYPFMHRIRSAAHQPIEMSGRSTPAVASSWSISNCRAGDASRP